MEVRPDDPQHRGLRPAAFCRSLGGISAAARTGDSRLPARALAAAAVAC